MAVIQDMPAEILRRILELGAEDPTCFKGRDLYSAALVARAWTQPSQELLVHDWWWPIHRNAIRKNGPEYDTPPPPTRRLRFVYVDSPDSAAKARRLIERHDTLLRRLAVYYLVSASDVLFFLLNGVRDLILYGVVDGDLACPNGTALALTSLTLDSSDLSSSTFVGELIANAPHLTRLTLDNTFEYSATYRAPLVTLAPQLRHLTLWDPRLQPSDGDLDPCALLRTCTSLVSLDLKWLQSGQLSTLLASIPTRLAIFTCSFDDEFSTDKSVSSDLLCAVKQPALVDLKRWRWVDRIREEDNVGASYSEETVQRWEAACRARGIEPRGDERYFTD